MLSTIQKVRTHVTHVHVHHRIQITYHLHMLLNKVDFQEHDATIKSLQRITFQISKVALYHKDNNFIIIIDSLY